MKNKSDLALIGIAVMGENLALNLASKGYQVTVFSRNQETVDTFLNGRAKGKTLRGTSDYQTLLNDIEKPRKILLMIKAGHPVDQVIEQLIPMLDQGDIIIDGGNSLHTDTTRRTKYLESKGFLFVGTGVSGGEEGALLGPSIMPGGSKEAWPLIKPMFQSIAAKVENGDICCDWVGPEGAGHFVKMVHNGIEYGDMQLISEAYHIMKSMLQLTNDDMSKIFDYWNQGELDSYLIEITAEILKFKDENNQYLIDFILDKAGQKGTGKWTVSSSLDNGVPLTLIGESVFSRFLSSMKDERITASAHYPKEVKPYVGDKKTFIDALKNALYASKIISYTQGYALMKAQAELSNWDLNYGGIALMWRGGCIIRSAFLDKIKQAFEKNPNLENLLLDDYFKDTIKSLISPWRQVVAQAILNGIPVPAMSSALSYFDGYTSKTLPANLLQAQRDYFGAHTYERIDEPRGEYFHTNWTGRGGKTSSTTYEK
jgi:6-phosphogluconate dehydrogenase